MHHHSSEYHRIDDADNCNYTFRTTKHIFAKIVAAELLMPFLHVRYQSHS